MSELLWKYDELIQLSKSEEPEVRYWAVDRLTRHFPTECCDAIEGLLLDEHDATPATVARHLGEYGSPKHHAILARGFRVLRGVTPGYCLQALVRLGYSGAVGLARDALKRGDLTDAALAIIVEALASVRTEPAQEAMRELIGRKVEVLAEPPALRGVFGGIDPAAVPTTVPQLIAAMKWRGSQEAGDVFRALMDVLEVDDAGWCFRTSPGGNLELRKTVKAVESGYDCEIIRHVGDAAIDQLDAVFRRGDLEASLTRLAAWTAELADGTQDEQTRRIAATAAAFAIPAVLDEFRRLGNAYERWLIGFELSSAFAVARRSAPRLTLSECRGDLGKLLELAEVETAFHLKDLPAAIAVVCREDDERAREAQAWCLRMLEAQGPFFPKVVALATLGELRATHFIPEVMEYLSEENSYVYGAAERALARMGDEIVAPAVARLQAGTLDPDAAHSLLVLLCDTGSQAAYEAVMRHLDAFMDIVGPGTTAEWASLFGTEELIEPLRDWLDEDPAMVGQGLLLLGAIHNVQIPEEDEIIKAIEDERSRQQDEEPGLEATQGGDYVM